jgi:hypothetical protein
MTGAQSTSLDFPANEMNRLRFNGDFPMSDGRDKQTKTDSTENKSSITFLDVHGKHKPKKPPDQHLVLAQQVSGIGQYGQVAPIAKKNVTDQAIKRENEDHNANGSNLPATGTSPAEQRRALAGAQAKSRADQHRLANQRELERDPMSILSATVDGFKGAAVAEVGRRGYAYYQRHNDPHLRQLQQPFTTFNEQIAQEKQAFARATKGTPEYARLQERIRTYERLKLGQKKSADGKVISQDEMDKLEKGEVKGFTEHEIAQLKDLQAKEKLLLAEQGELGAGLQMKRIATLGRLGRGVAGATGTYIFDETIASNLKQGGHDNLAEFMHASPAEMWAMGATWALPVPKSMPLSGEGPWYARLGGRIIWEATVYAGTKILAYGYDKATDPDVEKAHLESAHQAQNEDHQKKTPDSMNDAIDAWKKLGNHNNQIQQAIDETASQIGTTDPVKLEQVRRDLVALYAAYGETRLEMGTRVGGPASDGSPIMVNGAPVKDHYIFAGKDYDFGGIAMRSLNTARNGLNELGIPINDEVSKRVYSSLKNAYMMRITDPHKDFPDIYNQLKDMVHKNDPDAQWLSTWLATRVTDQKKMLHSEETAVKNAELNNQTFTATYNEYSLAKVYQDQALLDLAYAANGQDAQTHMQAAHDELKLAKYYGWDGRTITVNGEKKSRESDLPKIIEIYTGLGGKVDW